MPSGGGWATSMSCSTGAAWAGLPKAPAPVFPNSDMRASAWMRGRCEAVATGQGNANDGRAGLFAQHAHVTRTRIHDMLSAPSE